jgi:hypothetical protein
MHNRLIILKHIHFIYPRNRLYSELPYHLLQLLIIRNSTLHNSLHLSPLSTFTPHSCTISELLRKLRPGFHHYTIHYIYDILSLYLLFNQDSNHPLLLFLSIYNPYINIYKIHLTCFVLSKPSKPSIYTPKLTSQ